MSHILIVDDEPFVLDAIATLLTDEGYRVRTAPDGHVALEMMGEERPALLITDVMMPCLDGWAVLASVREHTPTLPVIVMSAVDRLKAPHHDALRMDHTVFLRKPFDIDALLTLVTRLLGSQSR